MEFEYRVLEAGWAEARLAHAADSVELSASYLSDALGDLIEAVALVLEGVPSAQCSWLEEPGEFRWRFLRSDGHVLVEILWLEDWDKLDDAGQLVFALGSRCCASAERSSRKRSECWTRLGRRSIGGAG